jgi:hypothetical protein
LDSAHIILLLISSDFMASDYCYDIEVKRAMKRHETGDGSFNTIDLSKDFVIPSGSDYLFTPSIAALKDVLAS